MQNCRLFHDPDVPYFHVILDTTTVSNFQVALSGYDPQSFNREFHLHEQTTFQIHTKIDV